MVIRRFDVFLVSLDPTVGSEIQKMRPCAVVSPDEMNRRIGTVIVAPMTTRGTSYPTRVPCTFQGKRGQVVLDQIRAVDRARLVRRLGTLSKAVQDNVLRLLQAWPRVDQPLLELLQHVALGGELVPEGVGEPDVKVRERVRPPLGGIGRGRRFGADVHHRHQQLDAGDAVHHAVVDFREDPGPVALQAVNDVHLPERLVSLQLPGEQLRG